MLRIVGAQLGARGIRSCYEERVSLALRPLDLPSCCVVAVM